MADDIIYVSMAGKEIDTKQNIDIYPDNNLNALVASLYSSVDFLKKEIDEKNIFIRKLLEIISNSKFSESKEQFIETASTSKKTFIKSPLNCSLPHDSMRNSVSMTYFNDQLNNIPEDNRSISSDDESINDYTVRSCAGYNYDDSLGTPKSSKTNNSENINNMTKISNTQQNLLNQPKSNLNTSSSHKWPKNTLLIASDSILNQMDEKRLSGTMNVKVRAFGGSSIEDMHSYITPLLRKEPDYILLHVGGNDCASQKTSDEIICDLLELKTFIESKLPNCVIIISTLTERIDKRQAGVISKNVNAKLKLLDIHLLNNDNIKQEHLGKKGLHLNKFGTCRIAMNIISLIKRL